MPEALAILLLFQLAGDALARVTGLPVPGPVLGFALLFLVLLARRDRLGRLPDAASGLHSHLSLLFVPAGTGVLLYLPALAREWVPIVAAVVTSTLVGLVVTALVARALMRRVTPLPPGTASIAPGMDIARDEATA
ncbi:MAG: CidA/LrgA family protein [Gemmatimonadaceae bacterium]|jgi:holin-like protein|nr:CidA/LrgA family protein [Gemmatimonadaceae bacterium]